MLNIASPRRLASFYAAVRPSGPGPERDQCLDDCVHQVHDYSNHRVGNDQAVACVGQLQSQAAVDDSQNQPEPTPPDVGIAEDAAAASLHELLVVDEAESRLNCKHADHNSAELNVRVGKELEAWSAVTDAFGHGFTHHISLLSAVYAKAEASPHEQPGHHLPA